MPVVSLLVFLLPCTLAGYGLNLLSLLTGKQTEEVPTRSQELPDYGPLYETGETEHVDIEKDGLQERSDVAGYGLNLLSLLMGKQKENDLDLTREPKNVDIDTGEMDHLSESREPKEVDIETGEERGLLDTLNLSLAGNLDISNAVGQVSSIE